MGGSRGAISGQCRTSTWNHRATAEPSRPLHCPGPPLFTDEKELENVRVEFFCSIRIGILFTKSNCLNHRIPDILHSDSCGVHFVHFGIRLKQVPGNREELSNLLEHICNRRTQRIDGSKEAQVFPVRDLFHCTQCSLQAKALVCIKLLPIPDSIFNDC